MSNVRPLHMQSLVSEELMNATWQKVGASSGAQALELQKKCGREQEELAAFVVAFTSQLSPSAAGLALYAYIVVAEAFRQSGAKFRKVKPGRITRAWEETEGPITALMGAGRPDSQAIPESVAERAVLRYILDALSPDQDEPVELSDEEYWHILRVLMTVSNCLHGAHRSA